MSSASSGSKMSVFNWPIFMLLDRGQAFDCMLA